MTKNVLFATIIGAILVFAWGMFSWTVLTWHEPVLNSFVDEATISETVILQAPTSGVYRSPAVFAEVEEQSKPYIFMAVAHSGVDGSMRTQLIQKFITLLVGAFLISLLVAKMRAEGYMCRFGAIVLVSIIVALLGNMPNFIWRGFDLDYTLVAFADTVIAWAIAAIFMAAILGPPKEA